MCCIAGVEWNDCFLCLSMQVLAVFEQIHVGHLLHILVFGESLLNGVYMCVCMCMCVCI